MKKKQPRPLGVRQIAKRDEMLAKHMSLVPVMVASYLKTHPDQRYLQDDMIASAYWRMVYAANTCVRTGAYVKNIKGYLRFAARTGIGEAVRKEGTILSPRYCPAKRVRDKEVDRYLGEVPSSPTHAGELLEACCADDIDTELLRLLFNGATRVQICKQLKIDKNAFVRRRSAIDRRMEAITGEQQAQ